MAEIGDPAHTRKRSEYREIQVQPAVAGSHSWCVVESPSWPSCISRPANDINPFRVAAHPTVIDVAMINVVVAYVCAL